MPFFPIWDRGSGALVVWAKGIPAVQIDGSDAWMLIAPRPSAAKEVAEEVDIRRSAPKGAFDFERLAVSLKRYPDTKLH
jgi:hypothetical protein